MIIFKNKVKEGVASFYIVAFSTLILMIVAISFATVIISEVERTSNDDLAQSAYDSALAGIEDAKLAYYNYQNCLNQSEATGGSSGGGQGVTCANILEYMKEANSTKDKDECDTVWNILGRESTGGNVVEITSEDINNNMNQATTCVAMTDETEDYKGNLSPSNAVDVIKLSFDEETVNVDNITSMRLSWFSKDDATKATGKGLNFNYENGFPDSAILNAPPVVALTLLQTGGQTFTMDQFNRVSYNPNQTNRGTLFLVPDNSGTNLIGSQALVKSNDKTVQNEPIDVGCAGLGNDIADREYACSVMINLPQPIGGPRNKNTFEVVVNLPYGQPESEFVLQFYCGGGACGNPFQSEENEGSEVSVATLKGVQIAVDSTGRANDLYRRVVTRLKNKNDLALTVMGPLELLDSGNDDAGMKKTWPVTSEYNFN